jgi:response regulator RpfG family c-di-GMP phosphodiesterase
MTLPRILLVDDDPQILSAQQRSLRGKFDVVTAQGGREGLLAFHTAGPFEVVVADMTMPHMNGVEFLIQAQKIAPDTVRIMLTGNLDQRTAAGAVNEGAVFRFLNKPCTPEAFAAALADAVRQHRLITAERELLEKTLKGSLDVMVELLSLVDPATFGRAQDLADWTQRVARHMGLENPWIVGLASMLSQIGALTIPGGILEKFRAKQLLTAAEREVYHRVPEVSADLIAQIPRLEEVSRTIRYTHKNFNGSGHPGDEVRGEAIPPGARIIRAVSDFLNTSQARGSRAVGLAELKFHPGWYDPKVIEAIEALLGPELPAGAPPEAAALGTRAVPLSELQPGDVLARPILTQEGVPVLPEGTILGHSHLERLKNFRQVSQLQEPVLVVY